MTAYKTKPLLWDDPKFSSNYSAAEQTTGIFGEMLLEQAGLRQYPHRAQLTVLDNACGIGVITVALHKIMKDRPQETFTVTCADFADAMVDSITKRIELQGWTNTNAVKADAQSTKFPGQHFTHIFTNFGPMLLPDASAMLSECNRILKPGGVCAFTTWQKVGWIDDFREAISSMLDLPQLASDDEIANAFAPGKWTDMGYISEQLALHGFERVNVEAKSNITRIESVDSFGDTLKILLAIIYNFWTDEQRREFGNKQTEDRLAEWFRNKYQHGSIEWHWVALLATSNKPQ